MSEPKKRAAKSETLTIRLDPKTRFMLEFMSRARGQTITTVVERAIIAAASETTIEVENEFPLSWQDIWDVNEGVRAIKMSQFRALFPSYEEERRLDFAKHHWQFFWKYENFMHVISANFAILWPDIDQYVEIWHTNMKTDYFAAGREMEKALRRAGLQPPSWPGEMTPSDLAAWHEAEYGGKPTF